jgi:hypothetical protein
MNMYLFFSAFASRPSWLLASCKASAFPYAYVSMMKIVLNDDTVGHNEELVY